MILKEKLENLLNHHDWFYEYADDHSKWKKGFEESLEIDKLIKELNLSETEKADLMRKYKPEDM